jgi:secreted trypsin-like serine protease
LTEESEEQKFAVDSILIHPVYHSPFNYDIAMVRLHTPANYTANILPICLQETELPAGTKCMIAGWGTRTSDALDYPQFLREGAVPIIDQPTCQSLYSRVTTISFDKVCAGYTTGTVDACQGDSGGPLMCQQGNKWYLAGLTSFGFDCAAKGYPGVYANVATLYNWVESQLLQN